LRLLLDSHIWLWSFDSPERLSRRVRGELANSRNELWLSPLSIWELLLAAEKGRIEIDRPAGEWIRRALSSYRFQEAIVTNEVVLETGNVKIVHRDPIDRFLAATARAFDLTLVTADRKLLAGTGFSALAN